MHNNPNISKELGYFDTMYFKVLSFEYVWQKKDNTTGYRVITESGTIEIITTNRNLIDIGVFFTARRKNAWNDDRFHCAKATTQEKYLKFKNKNIELYL